MASEEKETGEVREASVSEGQSKGKTPSDDEEDRHFQQIVHAFKSYRTCSLKRLMKSEKSFRELPSHHQALLPKFLDNLQMIRTCIDHNYEVLKLVLQDIDCMFENRTSPRRNKSGDSPKSVSHWDMDKLKTTLKQVVRDWSADGKPERDACYRPVIDQILKLFPTSKCEAADVQVLVPGAGLGRLAFEIARHGYSCQGNEFSLFMLFVSNFILNKCQEQDMFTLYPWVHQHCNLIHTEDQTKSITFPDVSPTVLPSGTAFSMAAGEFVEIYKEPEAWDCVATVFFLDTAHNVIEYIETIHKILKPGGIWINMGPLLYHFADISHESSIELSYDEVRNVIMKYGFEVLEEETGIKACYTQHPSSMLKSVYECVFLVLRKPQNPVQT